MNAHDPPSLPPGLPVPVGDGAADHLLGLDGMLVLSGAATAADVGAADHQPDLVVHSLQT